MKNEYYLLQNEAIDVILNYFENISSKKKIDGELCMALRTLEKMKGNNEKMSWKQLGAIAAVEGFIAKNDGHSPKRSDISTDEKLPSAPVFKTIFGKSVHQWCLENYPAHTLTSSNQFKYGGKKYKNAEEVKCAFVAEYYRLKPMGQDDFDRRKEKTVPLWQSMAELLGVTSWNKLIDKLELPRYGKNNDVPIRSISANITITNGERTFSETFEL